MKVLLAYAGFVLAGLSAGVSGVLLPAQIDDYGVDKAIVGLTFFTNAAGFLLAGAATGPLLHRFGIRATLALGGAATVLAWLYLASRPAFVLLVLAQLLLGFGIGVSPWRRAISGPIGRKRTARRRVPRSRPRA